MRGITIVIPRTDVRLTIVISRTSVRLFRLSVTLMYREHIDWTGSKLITRIISFGSSRRGHNIGNLVQWSRDRWWLQTPQSSMSEQLYDADGLLKLTTCIKPPPSPRCRKNERRDQKKSLRYHILTTAKSWRRLKLAVLETIISCVTNGDSLRLDVLLEANYNGCKTSKG